MVGPSANVTSEEAIAMSRKLNVLVPVPAETADEAISALRAQCAVAGFDV
jgi:hypothetical protein